MNKWISLLCAGLLMSAVMMGCNKPEEGDTSGTTTSGSGKSDMKSGTDTPEQPKTDDAGGGEMKKEGTGETGGEMKTGETGGEMKSDGASSDTKTGESGGEMKSEGEGK